MSDEKDGVSPALSFPGKARAAAEASAIEATQLAFDYRGSRRADVARHAFIEGDNLQALRHLRHAYRGRVSVIYIDPPYNRNRDFVYRDRWSKRGNVAADPGGHVAWVSMMLPRLLLAKEVLKDDGLIFLSIDDREVHHLRMLLDEVFGADCFVAQIVVVTNRGGRDYMRVATGHEYLLCYGGSPRAPVREEPRPAGGSVFHDSRGAYELRELRNRNPRFGPHNRPNLFYPLYVHPGASDADGGLAVSLEPAEGYDICVEPRNRTGAAGVWRWGKPRVAAALHHGSPAQSDVVSKRRRDGGYNIYEKCRKATRRPRALWDDSDVRSECGTIETRALWGQALFDHPKPVALVRRCLQMANDIDGIVLDFFAGSGTTGQAVLEQNAADGGRRRFVLVQRPEPTPAGSDARAAGFANLAALCRSRIHRLLERYPSEGLRGFAIDTREREHPLLWSAALALGVPLHATWHRDGDLFAFEDREVGDPVSVVWLRRSITAADVKALGLPAGTLVACSQAALDDLAREALAERYELRLLRW